MKEQIIDNANNLSLFITLLNSLSLSWKMTVIAFKIQFENVNINWIPLQLKVLEEDIKANKNYELMMNQEKPSGNHIPCRPKPFKCKFNNKFKNNISFQKYQVSIIKYYKCERSVYIYN